MGKLVCAMHSWVSTHPADRGRSHVVKLHHGAPLVNRVSRPMVVEA